MGGALTNSVSEVCDQWRGGQGGPEDPGPPCWPKLWGAVIQRGANKTSFYQ